MEYCRTFAMPEKEDQENIDLKEHHTLRVAENCARIAREEGLDDSRVRIAEAIGLLHDVGRFPQYAQYRTYKDSVSLNHGMLGAEIIREKGIVSKLPEKTQKQIVKAVKFHNSLGIPDLDDEETILFLRLIRDADKLDIWKVFADYYEGKVTATATALGLPDTPDYSPQILSSVKAGKGAVLADMRVLNDFRLLKLSWVYDLNFPTTYRILLEKGYLTRISAGLPWNDEIEGLITSLSEYTERKAGINV
ncbi:MAG: HD domain-containing protein [Thermodesulfovibrionales bacterium]